MSNFFTKKQCFKAENYTQDKKLIEFLNCTQDSNKVYKGQTMNDRQRLYEEQKEIDKKIEEQEKFFENMACYTMVAILFVVFLLTYIILI